MALGRDSRRLPSTPVLPVALAEPGWFELLDAPALRRQAESLAVATAAGSAHERASALLRRAALLREHARRTGAPEDLARAADDADRAQRLLAPALASDARMQLALCALEAAELFGDDAALEAAALRLSEGEAANDLPTRPLFLARRAAARARVASARAVADRQGEAAMRAAERHDEAVAALDPLARRDPSLWPEAAAARVERAALLTSFAPLLKEADLAAQAADDLAAVSDRLDADRLPLTFARVETGRGEALLALGELQGDAAALTESAAAFVAALEAAPPGWSPLDRARAARGLGHARRALAEALEEPALYDAAADAFDLALKETQGAQGLPLRAACAFDRATALARRAGRTGDPAAVAWAEGALKAQLSPAPADPVVWAALQVALASLYLARARASNDDGDAGRAQAALAVEAAVEVFTERGLKSLAEQALETLR